jgi:hypothetical protein
MKLSLGWGTRLGGNKNTGFFPFAMLRVRKTI